MQKQENKFSVKINGVNISYAENAKSGAPSVIFIHGFPFNKTMWKAQTDALKDRYHVIAYDIRGHGHSEEGTENFSIDLFVRDLIGLMDHLKLDEAILCGLSLGGYIALDAISKFPNRFVALVLSDTQCAADTSETQEKRMKAIESIQNGGLEKYADDSIRNLFAPGSFISRSREIADVRQMILTTSKTSLCKTLLALAQRKETCSILPGIKVPVIVLVGNEDKITPPTAAKYLSENIKGASVQTIEKAGHLSNMENPEIFNKELIRFLATVS